MPAFSSNHLISILSSIAAILVAVNYANYSKTRGEQNAQTVNTDRRQPASQDLSQQALEIPCSSAHISVLPHQEQVRLVSDSCQKAELPEIKNRSNGHTASLFHHDNQIMTDFIAVEPGENEIEIRWPDRTTHILTIRR